MLPQHFYMEENIFQGLCLGAHLKQAAAGQKSKSEASLTFPATAFSFPLRAD